MITPITVVLLLLTVLWALSLINLVLITLLNLFNLSLALLILDDFILAFFNYLFDFFVLLTLLLLKLSRGHVFVVVGI